MYLNKVCTFPDLLVHEVKKTRKNTSNNTLLLFLIFKQKHTDVFVLLNVLLDDAPMTK